MQSDTEPATPPEESAAAPTGAVAAIVNTAVLADPRDVAKYAPNAQDLALAGALFGAEFTTFEDLAAAANISVATLSRIRQDPTRVAWVVSQAYAANQTTAPLVYAHIARQAATSRNPMWAKIYLEHFDDRAKKAAAAQIGTQNNQFNFLSTMSATELIAMVNQQRRRTLGAPE